MSVCTCLFFLGVVAVCSTSAIVAQYHLGKALTHLGFDMQAAA